jgi:hypothetical protein
MQFIAVVLIALLRFIAAGMERRRAREDADGTHEDDGSLLRGPGAECYRRHHHLWIEFDPFAFFDVSVRIPWITDWHGFRDGNICTRHS